MTFLQIQTETVHIEEAPHYDPAKLSSFLKEQYQFVSEQLQENIECTAFDDYDADWGTTSSSCDHLSTILDCELLLSEERRIAAEATTTERASLKARIPAVSISSVDWSANGAYAVVATGEASHSNWCTHQASVQVWNTLRPNRLRPHTRPSSLQLDPARFSIEASFSLSCCATSVACHPELPGVFAVALSNGQIRLFDLHPRKGSPLTDEDIYEYEPMEEQQEQQQSPQQATAPTPTPTPPAAEAADDPYGDDYGDDFDDDYAEDFDEPAPAPAPAPVAAPAPAPALTSASAPPRLPPPPTQLASPLTDLHHREAVSGLAWVRLHTSHHDTSTSTSTSAAATAAAYSRYLLLSSSADGKVLAWELPSRLETWADSALLTRSSRLPGQRPLPVAVEEMRSVMLLEGAAAGAPEEDLGADQWLHGEVPVLGVSALDTPAPGAAAAAYVAVVGTEGGSVLGVDLRALHLPRRAKAIGGRRFSAEAAQVVAAVPPQNTQTILVRCYLFFFLVSVFLVFWCLPLPISLLQSLIEAARPKSDPLSAAELFAVLRSAPPVQRNMPAWALLSPPRVTTVFHPHAGPVAALACSRLVPAAFASCSLDGVLRVYNRGSTVPIVDVQVYDIDDKSGKMSGMSGFSGSACLRALAWSPVCASVLVVGDDAGVVRVYSFNLSSVSGGSGSDGLHSPALTYVLPAARTDAEEGVTSIRFCPGCPKMIAVSSRSGATHLLQLPSRFSQRRTADEQFIKDIGVTDEE
jgi:WD40 repeat protein